MSPPRSLCCVPSPRAPLGGDTHKLIASLVHIVLQVAAAVIGGQDGAQFPVARNVEAIVRGKHQQPRDVAPANFILRTRRQECRPQFPPWALADKRKRGSMPPQVFGDGGTHRQDPGHAPRLDSRTCVWSRFQRRGWGRGCGTSVGGQLPSAWVHAGDAREPTCVFTVNYMRPLRPNQGGPGTTAHGTAPPEKRHIVEMPGWAGGGLSHPRATCVRCEDHMARFPRGSCGGGGRCGGSRLQGSRHRAEGSGLGQDRRAGGQPARPAKPHDTEAWPGCPFPEGPRGRGGSALGTTRISPLAVSLYKMVCSNLGFEDLPCVPS